MATITYNSNFSEFVMFLEKLKANLTRPALKTIHWIIILFYLGKIEKISRRTIKKLKSTLANCTHGCENCPECWGKVLDAAREGRELLMRLTEVLPENSLFFRFARKKIESVLVDWDDFVEDLTLCVDDEFRNLANQLAQLV